MARWIVLEILRIAAVVGSLNLNFQRFIHSSETEENCSTCSVAIHPSSCSVITLRFSLLFPSQHHIISASVQYIMSSGSKENMPPPEPNSKEPAKKESRSYVRRYLSGIGKHLHFKNCKEMVSYKYKDELPLYFFKRPYNPTYYGAKYLKALDGIRDQLRELVAKKKSCLVNPNLFRQRYERFIGLCQKYTRRNQGAVQLYENINRKVFLHIELEEMPFWLYYSKNEKLRSLNMILLDRDNAEKLVVCYSNNTARKSGVKPGMSLLEARQLCNQVVEVTLDMEEYLEFAKKFFEGLGGYADDIEVVNFDEAIIDVTEVMHNSNGWDILDHYAFALRMCVNYYTNGADATLGFGHNRFMAMLATRQAKRRGLKMFYLQDVFVAGMMKILPIEELPVSKYTVNNLREAFPSMLTCGDMQVLSTSVLQKFSREGKYLNALALGEFESTTCFVTLYREIISPNNLSMEAQQVGESMRGLTVRDENEEQQNPTASTAETEQQKKVPNTTTNITKVTSVRPKPVITFKSQIQ